MKYAATLALLGLFLAGCPSGKGDPGNQSLNSGNGSETASTDGDSSAPISADIESDRNAIYQASWTYLKSQYGVEGTDRRGLDSGWGQGSKSIAYTAMVLNGLVGTPIWDDKDPMIKESVQWLMDTQNAEGFWSYKPDTEMGGAMKGVRAVYITSIVVQLFSELQERDAWKTNVKELNEKTGLARDYLKRAQVGSKEGPLPDFKKNDVGYGGWAYSEQELKNPSNQAKPASNMSTSTFAIDALHACGVDKSDPLWERALTFLKRNQNSGETYDENFEAYAEIEVDGKKEKRKIKPAAEGSRDHGGAIYSEETSKAGSAQPNADGTVTMFSYGAMTYNLLRAYMYAGLDKDSTPVKLAYGWITKNYTVERVPGYRDPAQYEMGLFYYFVNADKVVK
ncbi:MAG: prenyltransferase/squalene oxidase repeat-containing protein, partial [Planctomycetota bacterium]